MHLKKCDYCQEEFETLRITTNYCSPSCRQSAYRQRVEGGIEDENDDELEDEDDELEEDEELDEDEEQDEQEYEDEQEDEEDEEEPEQQEEQEKVQKSKNNTPTLDNTYPTRRELPKVQDEAEFFETEEVKHIKIYNKGRNAEISDSDTRQIQVTGIFIRYLIHLKNIYCEPVKRDSFEDLLSYFQDLQIQYMQKSAKQYALYPFSQNLEEVIIEMESYMVRIVKRKDKDICFDLGQEYLDELDDLVQDLKEYRNTLLKRYR